MFIWGHALYIYNSDGTLFLGLILICLFSLDYIFTGTNHSDASAFFCSYAEGYFFSEDY